MTGIVHCANLTCAARPVQPSCLEGLAVDHFPAPIVTSKHVCAYFGICEATIGPWVQKQRLPPPLPGSRIYRWRRETFLAFLEKLERKAEAV
ncbi:MAG: helix-turn-helix transcriptional regulator [Gemmataceae bacterium]